MAGYDFRSPRLYVEAPLEEGADVALNSAQAHYLGTVLRLKSGSRVLVFNGRDGDSSLDAFAAIKGSLISATRRQNVSKGDTR